MAARRNTRRTQANHTIDDYTSRLIQKLDNGGSTSNEPILYDNEREHGKRLLLDAERQLSARRLTTTQFSKEDSRLDKWRSVLATQRLVPPEILVEIFRFTAPWIDAPVTFPPTTSAWPWALRSVCSRWRQVAIREPTLWHWHEINLDGPRGYLAIPFFKVIIPSRGPLAIDLGGGSYQTAIQAVQELVLPNLQRINQLQLLHIPVAAIRGLLDKPCRDFSQITLLSLCFEDFVGHRDTTIIHRLMGTDILTQAYSLRSLQLSATSTDVARALLGLRGYWNSVTELDLSGFKSMPLQTLFLHFKLPQFVRLEKLVASLVGPPIVLPAHVAAHIFLPRLRSLTLKDRIPAAGVLSSLRIPWGSLTVLALHDATDLQVELVVDILRGCGALHTFSATIQRDSISHDHMHMPTVTHWQLRHLTINLVFLGTIFHCLILPRLTGLHVSSPAYNPAAALLQFVSRSRCQIVDFVLERGGGSCEDKTLDELLAWMQTAKRFKAPELRFSGPSLRSVAQRARLPHVEVLEFWIYFDDLDDFIAFAQVQAAGHFRVRIHAHIDYVPRNHRKKFKEMIEQLVAINQRYRTHILLAEGANPAKPGRRSAV